MQIDKYPVFLDEDEYVEFWKDYIEAKGDDFKNFSIYVHYPWCLSVCKFCIFGALKYEPGSPEIPAYENAVLNMMRKMAPIIEPKIADELFFGGGTPSLWTFESLRQMTQIIPNYDKIRIRRTEVHPHDLTPERVKFLIEEMKFHQISIGVQSFDRNANLGQNRIPVDADKLAVAVKEFQDNGLHVNMDLVALFNGDDAINWDIFENDLKIAEEKIHPDGITVSPNYKSSDYYGNSIEFRKIIKRFCDVSPTYHINNGDSAFSLDYVDIMKYMDSPYLLLTKEYSEFASQFPAIKENKTVEELTNRNIIGFGGMEKETCFSRTSELDFITGKYQFQTEEFRYSLVKRDVFKNLRQQEEIDLYSNSLSVGHYTLPPPLKRD